MNSSIQAEISKLKEEKNAIILAPNYQPTVVQEIADFLAKRALKNLKSAYQIVI